MPQWTKFILKEAFIFFNRRNRKEGTSFYFFIIKYPVFLSKYIDFYNKSEVYIGNTNLYGRA